MVAWLSDNKERCRQDGLDRMGWIGWAVWLEQSFYRSIVLFDLWVIFINIHQSIITQFLLFSQLTPSQLLLQLFRYRMDHGSISKLICDCWPSIASNCTGFLSLFYKYMNQILLILLLITAQSQIQTKPNYTLAQIGKNATSEDPQQTKAILYLLQSHPHLANYTVSSINSQINRTNQNYTSNLKDYLFELNSNSTRVRGMVTLSNLTKQSYVTVSPMVSAPLQPLKGKFGPVNEYSLLRNANRSSEGNSSPIINQSNFSSSRNNTEKGEPRPIKKPAPNSYILYEDDQDPLVQFALDYIAGVHPNIINYKISKEIYYQLVAGMNIKIHYVGYDKYSEITAVVYFDLKLIPMLVSFQVDCITSLNSTCRPLQVWNIYQSVQWILIYHPELFSYQVSKVEVLSRLNAEQKMRVVITFQNSAQKMRSLFEVQITLNRVTVLSFYTYSYQQS